MIEVTTIDGTAYLALRGVKPTSQRAGPTGRITWFFEGPDAEAAWNEWRNFEGQATVIRGFMDERFRLLRESRVASKAVS